LWAIELTEASFGDWSASEKGREISNDLATLGRVYSKLINA
jgi:hypothetical protein